MLGLIAILIVGFCLLTIVGYMFFDVQPKINAN